MKLDKADKFIILYMPVSIVILLFIGGYCAIPNGCCSLGCFHSDWQIPATILLFIAVILGGIIPFCHLSKRSSVSKNNKKVKLTLIIVFIVVTATMGGFLTFLALSGLNRRSYIETPTISFYKDSDTLTVTGYNYYDPSGSELIWENIEIDIQKGNATLPTGYIDIGDVITNCTGEVCLVWEPTSGMIWRTDFSK